MKPPQKVSLLDITSGSRMHIIDPLSDPRWEPFIEGNESACAFHSSGWLRALAKTYGYEPLAVTSSPAASELSDAVLLCRVESWATGRRLVSLPFTDHCQVLANDDTNVPELAKHVAEFAAREKYRFCELRPLAPVRFGDQHRSGVYAIHWLDLRPSIESIFRGFDKDSIQRKLRRAEREGLQYEEGSSAEMIDKFYRLLLRTRRRHQLPPQPIEWFRNLAESMRGSIQFRLALKEEEPIAAIVTLTDRNTIIYKYGGSDERYHATGSMPFLFWRAIQEAKATGRVAMDFGRSDLDNPGLIRFKDEWGTSRAELTYYRFPAPKGAGTRAGLAERAATAVFSRIPDRVLAAAGRLMYRHIG